MSGGRHPAARMQQGWRIVRVEKVVQNQGLTRHVVSGGDGGVRRSGKRGAEPQGVKKRAGEQMTLRG